MHSKIIKELLNRQITVATAESCSGGLLSYSFIKHKGISKIFSSGLICYSNFSKVKYLKTNKKLINKYGAVSYEVSKKMTENLSKISHSKLSITTTGIAGPSGNSKNKPIGLVFIGIKYNSKLLIYKKKFKGSRIQIQKQTINFIFQKLEELI